jgi:hypothetical protein
MTDQHFKNFKINLKLLREFPDFQLRELLLLPTSICIFVKCFELNTFYLFFIISPFFIILFLQLTTQILIESKKLKLVLKSIILR